MTGNRAGSSRSAVSACRSSDLRVVVGAAAIVAPILHSVTDAMEWYQHGFSQTQLWLNYVAFLPMPWLLLGIYSVCEEELGVAALVGALLYGIAFTRAALRAGGLPRPAVWLFGTGLLVNLMLALAPAPDILQTVGRAVRNAGLVGMGYAIWLDRPPRVPEQA